MTPDESDLAALRRALAAATPPPDPAAKARHLRLAQDSFARLHASAATPSATSAATSAATPAATPAATDAGRAARLDAGGEAQAVARRRTPRRTHSSATRLADVSVGDRPRPASAFPGDDGTAAGAPGRAGATSGSPRSGAARRGPSALLAALHARPGRLALPGGAGLAAAAIAGLFLLTPEGQQLRRPPAVAPPTESLTSDAETSRPADAMPPPEAGAPLTMQEAPEPAPATPAAADPAAQTPTPPVAELAQQAEPEADTAPKAADGHPEAGPAPPPAAETAQRSAPVADAAPEAAVAPPDAAGAEAETMRAPPPVAELAQRTAPETALSEATPAPGDGWAAVRAALDRGELPPPESVDVEALVGALAEPAAAEAIGDGLRLELAVTAAPWAPDRRLLRVTLFGVDAGARSAEIALAQDPAAVDSIRRLARSAPGGGAIDLGPIAPDQTATLLFEVTPARRQPASPGPASQEPASSPDALGTLHLAWTSADGERRDLDLLVGPPAPPDFAAAVAGFGALLQGTDLGAWGLDDALALATATHGADPSGQRAEAMRLMRRAQALVP